MLARRSALLYASLLACHGQKPPAPVLESELPPPAAATDTGAREPLARPTAAELSVTDKAGRSMRVSLEREAFARCLTAAAPGERGYVLFGFDGNEPDSKRLLEAEGLSAATVACIGDVLVANRDGSILLGGTLWYLSVQP